MTKYIAADLECSTLNTVRGEGLIHCIAFWNDEVQVCFEWGDKAIDFLAGLLAEGYILVFHSAQYDVATLRHFTGFDIPPSQFRCTQVLAHAINPQLNSYSLDSLTGTKLNYAEKMIQSGRFTRTSKTKDLTSEEYKRLFAIPFNPVMEEYNLGDVHSTWDLWTSYQPHLDMDERLRIAYETIQNPFVDVVISMHNGMHVDVPAMYDLVVEVNADITSEYSAFLEEYPRIPKLKWDKDGKEWVPNGEFVEPNLASPNDVTSLLYMHGWTPEEFSRETGRPTTDKGTLQRLIVEEATKPPLKKIAKRMLDIRSLTGIETQCSTALKILTENGVPYIYANWHQTGTKTGRMASSNCNMQNWSVRHPKWGKRMRACFTPPPGYAMLVGDLSQVELAVLAFYLELIMGDSDMAQAVRDHEDIHDANTRNWTGVQRGDENFKAKRSVCKNGAFASSYGAKARRLALTLCISVSEAQEILNVLEASIPIEALKKFVYSVVSSPREVCPVKYLWARYQQGFFYDCMGVRHFYPEILSKDRYKRSKAERQAFNCLMQGSVGSMFMSLCIKLLPHLKRMGGWIVSTIHDEVIFVVKEEYAEEALEIGNEVFNSIILPTKEGGVPIRSSFDIVTNWSEKG